VPVGRTRTQRIDGARQIGISPWIHHSCADIECIYIEKRQFLTAAGMPRVTKPRRSNGGVSTPQKNSPIK